MKKVFFFFIFLSTLKASGQECKNCGNRTAIAFYKIEWLNIQKPDNPELLKQWEKLDILWPEISYQFDQYFRNDQCLFIRQVGQGMQNDDLARDVFKYSIYGIIIQSSSDLLLKLWMQQSCSKKIMAETEVRFQLYPILDEDRIAQQAVAQFAPLIKIFEFETEQRKSNNLPFGGNLHGGRIEVQILNRNISIGQQTGIALVMKDCDGKTLPNQEISCLKTKGGSVHPAIVKTDAHGKALATFKLSASLKGDAIIIAQSSPINAKGCKDFFTGEAILAAPDYFVSAYYLKKGTRYVNWKSEDSIMAITLANESEVYSVVANASLYHFTSSAGKKTSSVQIFPEEYTGGKSAVIELDGTSNHYRITKSPEVEVVPLNAKHKIEADTAESINSNVLLPPWVAFDFKNDTLYNFEINFDFPDDEKGSPAASGALRCRRGDKDASFETRKINDAGSPYKTEYIIRYVKETSEKNQLGNSTEYEEGFVRILTR